MLAAERLEPEVREFFERVSFAGVLLPDGWFGGRPMDSFHELTFVAARPKRLILELDEQLLFSFAGRGVQVELATTDLALTAGTPMLIVSGFSLCVLEWLEYVNDHPHLQSYDSGRVCFVGARQA